MADALPTDISSAPGRVAMNRLLVLGLLLRVGIFVLASPFNSDQHFEVIEYIARTHTLPVSNLLQQSHHPPLYHLLMVPLYLLSPQGVTWPIHLASCVISCANLVLIRKLMDHPLVLRITSSAALRIAAFALVATHAQLMLFGSFISNDTLAELLGTALFAALLAYLHRTSPRHVFVLAAIVALGLLTKGTFLLTGGALAPIVCRAAWRRIGARRAIALTAAFCATWLVFGSFKYVDNAIRAGRPFAFNLDLGFKPPYPTTIWRGPSTIYDLDVTELIRHPVIRPAEPTSYPLTLYATFWYAHFGGNSFAGNVSGYENVGRLTYAVAIVPTLVFLLGVGRAVGLLKAWLLNRDRDDLVPAIAVASLALFLANLVIVVAAGVKFDRWDSFQARLLFPSMMPMLVLFLLGLATLPAVRGVRAIVLAFCWATASCGVLYLLIEFALARRLLDVNESLLFETQGPPRVGPPRLSP